MPFLGQAHSTQTGPGTSRYSYSELSLLSRPDSLFLLTIPKQDLESLSAAWLYCFCQAASFLSVGTRQTQDCYTWSWSCKYWFFYGSFTVRWGASFSCPVCKDSLWNVKYMVLTLSISTLRYSESLMHFKAKIYVIGHVFSSWASTAVQLVFNFFI